MDKIVKLLTLTLYLFLPFLSQGQNQVEMADSFRSDGKIYVVIAVVLLVLGGLVAYLIATDKKLKKLEDEIEDNI